jgi:hypothetical protein
MCARFLTNPVIEDATVTVTAPSGRLDTIAAWPPSSAS